MSLSDKITYLPITSETHNWFHIDDVKDAVKKLKETLCQRPPINTCGICINCKMIDEEFGEKLI